MADLEALQRWQDLELHPEGWSDPHPFMDRLRQKEHNTLLPFTWLGKVVQ